MAPPTPPYTREIKKKEVKDGNTTKPRRKRKPKSTRTSGKFAGNI
jgi:hypothetical protein